MARRRSRLHPVAIGGVFLGAVLGSMTGSAPGPVQAPVDGLEPGTSPAVGIESPDPTGVIDSSLAVPARPKRAAAGAAPIARQATTPALQFDATYDFDIQLDYVHATVSAVERLVATNLASQPAHALNLFVLPNQDADGFREFELGSVDVDGKTVSVEWSSEGVNMIVPLRRPIGPGASTDVVIAFTLHPRGDVDDTQQAALSRANGVLQLLYWYPILSDGHGAPRDGDPMSGQPDSAVTYLIRSATPVLMAVPGEVDHRTTLDVSGRLEHARDFAFAVSPAFETWTGASGGTTVSVYAPRGSDGGVARDIAVDRLARFGALLAVPYPADEFVIVGGSMDMESSGIAFVKDADLANEYAVAHEIAHQWFDWLVGNDQLREPWLDEAFATYLAGGLRPRHEDGYCSNAPVNSAVDRFPAEPLETSWQDCDSYVQTIYYKGSWMLAWLRSTMGDEAFLAALREYVSTYRFRIATSADLVGILRRHHPGLIAAGLGRWLALDANEVRHRRSTGTPG